MFALRSWALLGIFGAFVCCDPPLATAADLGTSEAPGLTDPTHPFFRHRFMLQGGAAFNTLDTTARVGRAGISSGSSISLEDDLGFDSQRTSIDALARVRLGERWNMEFSYFDASRSKSATADRTIEFGRLEFPASATIQGDFGLAAYRLALGYAFHKTSTTELGVALSLYVHDFSVAASGSANVGGLAAGFQSERYSVLAPMPTLGLFVHHALTSRWLISGRLDWMNISLDSINVAGVHLKDAGGSVLSLELGTEYRLFENIAVGAAYRYQDVSFGATVSGLSGQLSYTTSSPIAFVRTSF